MANVGEGPYIPHVFGDEVQERLKQGLSWLTAAVHHSISWPSHDVLVHYGGENYYLRGLEQQEGKLSEACITVPLSGSEQANSALRRVYEFTSILGWYLRGYVDVVGHIRGSRATLYSAGKQPFIPSIASGRHGFTCNFMPIIRSESTRKALAFFREGLRLEYIHPGYSFLSFYKVIESQFKDGNDRSSWINAAIPTLENKAGKRAQELSEQGKDVGRHIFESGRCAVAHASIDGELINPDIPEDRVRIAQDLVLVQSLAKKFIQEELSIPDYLDVYKGRDALASFYEYLDAEHIKCLKNGGSVLIKYLAINDLQTEVRIWPNQSFSELRQMTLTVMSAHEGIVALQALNEAKTLSLGFILDFINAKAHTNLEYSGVLPATDGGNPDDEIAFLRYQKAVIGNDIIEIQLPNGEIVVCEIVIPVNIDIGGTFAAIDKRIESIESASGS